MKHELSHIYIREKSPYGDIPRWLDEGIAQYLAGELRFELIWDLAWASANNNLIPLDYLSFYIPESYPFQGLGYIQSLSLINYLINQYGKDNLIKLLDSLKEEIDFEDAFEDVYKLDLKEFERNWKDKIKVKYGWVFILFSSDIFWFLVAVLFLIAVAKAMYKIIKSKRKKEENESEYSDEEIPFEEWYFSDDDGNNNKKNSF